MYSCYYWTYRWGRRLFVVLRISQPCALFASLAIYKRFDWTPLPLGSSWRYRLGVALSIDIPYLRALFIALSLMVQVVASLLFFCLFVCLFNFFLFFLFPFCLLGNFFFWDLYFHGDLDRFCTNPRSLLSLASPADCVFAKWAAHCV